MSYANRTTSANFNISFGDGGFSKPIQHRNPAHRRRQQKVKNILFTIKNSSKVSGYSRAFSFYGTAEVQYFLFAFLLFGLHHPNILNNVS